VRILVVNPNTTASMTTVIGEGCRAVAAADTEVTAINPAWGPLPSLCAAAQHRGAPHEGRSVVLAPGPSATESGSD
jgi:Asp/Glu/hydantoin racemase